MLSLGDKVFIEGEVVGIEKNREGRLTYLVEVPDQYCSDNGKERTRIYEDNTALVTQVFMSK